MARLAELPLIERVLIALKKEQRDFSDSAMAQPAHRDAFEYGRVSGHFSGIHRAIQIIEESLIANDEDNDHGFSRRGESRFTIRN